jgi:pimeloyl-ACP methyl ester carboxylesterase
MTIYIEGDGASWLLKTIPPRNPTPSQSLAAAMAAEDQNQLVMYLARPCQFIDVRTVKECDESMWTDGRFSVQIIELFHQAIDQILLEVPFMRLNLVGHSGGGTLATLIAAQRSDVNCLVTMASPLDITAWTRSLSIAPLTRSKNPAEPNTN